MTDILTLDGWGQRGVTFAFDLLDKQNSLLGGIDVDMDEPPTITNNINRAVKRTMSGLQLPPAVTADINTLTERVRPRMIFHDGTTYNLGVFLFADVTRQLVLSGSVQLSAAGEAWWSDGTMSDQLVTVNQGSRGINFYGPGHLIYDALEQQMRAAGILDYSIEPTSATIGDWIVWKPNTNRLKVINDLAAMAGFYSLYFDNDGVAILRSVPSMDSVDPTLVYEAGRNVLMGSISESDDQLSAYNTYVAVNSGFTQAPIWGEWRVPPEAPHSYENRGFWVVKEVDQQGLTSNSQATRAAKTAGLADFAAYRWANFSSAINPLHDTFDVVGWRGDKWREQTHSFQLAADAPHKHELRRVWSNELADIIEEEA